MGYVDGHLRSTASSGVSSQALASLFKRGFAGPKASHRVAPRQVKVPVDAMRMALGTFVDANRPAADPEKLGWMRRNVAHRLAPGYALQGYGRKRLLRLL